ncbi:MAG: hypothetical protein HY527_06900 [Betaproteobacteria bacterium]|nr:hypothetical protein [Betaproteobacteria bacterium]
MGTIYVLGAGFSKTCHIATDAEMLGALNPLLKATPQKNGGPPRTTIEHLTEQNFLNRDGIGFELFMSNLSSLKFLGDCWDGKRNVFREEERELRKALRRYLTECVKSVNWDTEGRAILDFMRTINWSADHILTFNYDQLLEAAAEKLGIAVGDRIIHLHGAVRERTLAWPTFTKFAYRTTKAPLAPRWKRAFELLRNQTQLDQLIFVGYSMPPADLEAKALFNYSDWYNSLPAIPFFHGKLVPASKRYSYEICVVNPNPDVRQNYKFFRRPPRFLRQKFEVWLRNRRR